MVLDSIRFMTNIFPSDSGNTFCHRHVTWNIHNFFNGPLDRSKVYESLEFEMDLPRRTTWRLALKHERKEIGEDFLTVISVQQSDSGTATLPCDIRIEIHELVPTPCIKKKISRRDRQVDFKVTGIYEDFISRDGTAAHKLNELKISCYFETDMVKYLMEWNTDEHLELLSNNLRDLYHKGDFKDLELTMGGSDISVHSAIVRERSPYIARRLSKWPGLRRIILTRFRYWYGIKGLIEYWYSGDINKAVSLYTRFSSTKGPNLDKTKKLLVDMEQDDLKPYFFPKLIHLSTTLVQSERFVNWTIKSSEFCKKIKESIEKGEFYEYTFRQFPWNLRFYTESPDHAYDVEQNNHIHFSVQEEGDIKSLHAVRLEAFLMDDMGKERGHKITMSWFDGNSPGEYHFRNFMSYDEFVRLQGELLKRDTFWLGCRILYGTGIEENDIETESGTVQHPFKVLSTAMKKLFENREHCDTTLIADGKSFKVHKAVLAARSKYFQRELFDKTFTEFKVDYIGLDDLIMILKYMYYAESIELNLELALRLYPAVREYEINGLYDLCSDFLQENATDKVAIDIFEKAHKFHDRSLKKIAVCKIGRHWNLISSSPEWRLFEKRRSDLVSEIKAEFRRNFILNKDSCFYPETGRFPYICLDLSKC